MTATVIRLKSYALPNGAVLMVRSKRHENGSMIRKSQSIPLQRGRDVVNLTRGQAAKLLRMLRATAYWQRGRIE